MKKGIYTIIIILMLAVCMFTLTACERYKVNIFGYVFYIGGDDSSSSVEYDEWGNPIDPNASSSVEDENSQNQGSASQSVGNGSQGGTSQKPDTSSQGGTSSQNPPASSSGGEGDIQRPTDDSSFVEVKALSETAYVIWKDTKAASASAYYKKTSDSNYTKVDQPLIRDIGGGQARVDILGLQKNTAYDIKVVVGATNKEFVCGNVTVGAYDRSGYAHYGYTKGVGAYNDDGTLKSGIKVVYITEATKNSESGGIVKALQQGNVCVRVIGKITTDTRKSASAWEGKYTKISGLSDEKKTGKEGTTWGMAEIQNKSNITFEGVGSDAEIFQWGVSFKRCNSVEVRNLTFTDYPEDACEFNGGDNNGLDAYGNYWVHNNLFNKGKRLFDDSTDQDKAEGDGAIDIKFCHNATYSYNKIANCHKTGLVGGSDENLQKNLTFHHNYFYKNESRMPLGRQANMHYYNNYFEGITGYCMSIRGNGYVFSEANYFESCKKTFEVKSGAVKSYQDEFKSCSINDGKKVTNRTDTVSNSCQFGNKFDTDSKNFYYDSAKKVTDVHYLTSAAQAKTDCVNLAGPCKANK